MRLAGRTAIVTGGGRGIGRGIVRAFAREGARVVVAQRDPETGEATCLEVRKNGGEARFTRTDVSDQEAVEALVTETVKAYGAVDILVNNAAITGQNGPVLEIARETWDRVIAVNLTGVFLCSQAAARVMAKQGRGSILNISSTNSLVPQPRCAAYAAAKGAVESLSKSLAIDLAPYGVRVNVIAPGPIHGRLPEGAPPPRSESTLVGRGGLPSEVAEAAVFLASDASAYITGQRLGVDGGILLNAYRIYGGKMPERSA